MQHQTVPQTSVDLSHTGVDRILAALAAAGLPAPDNDTDGHTYVEVWLTDLDTERGPTILSWRETTGWRLQSFAKPEDHGDNKPARTWPITAGSLAEVARDVAAILAEPAEIAAEVISGPIPHQELAAALHRLADDIAHHELPLPSYRMTVRGALPSRADLERWADFLGTKVELGGTAGDIPVTGKTIGIGGWRDLHIEFQSPAEPRQPEVDQLRTRVAELEAQLAQGGAK